MSTIAVPEIAAERRRQRSVLTLMLSLLTACAAFQLNASMLSPALVTLARELQIDEASAALAQTVFFTSTAVFGIFLPRWSDMIGRRRMMLIMLAAMTLGSVLAALAPTLGVLLVARALQGTSGPIVAVCLLILRSEVTDKRRYGTLMGLVAAVNGGIAGVDAILGGILASTSGFRSIFWVIAVLGLIALAFVGRWTPESRPSAGARMDWLGVLTLAVAILALQLGINETQQLAAANWIMIAVLVGAGILLLAVFLRVERRAAQPLAQVELLKRRQVWALLLTTILTLAGVLAAVNAVALSLAQNDATGFGLPADLTSIVVLTPYALLGWIVGPFAGRLAPVLGYRTVLRIGLAVSIIALVGLALFGATHFAVLVTCVFVLGVAYAGMANIMLNGLGVVMSPPENPGFLPGLNSAAFGFGAGISFAVLPAVQGIGAIDGVPAVSGYSLAFLAAACITALAFVASLLIPRPPMGEVTGDTVAITATSTDRYERRM